MKLYYDLHMHSALSPCGDGDMTPNNIVNMAYIKQLDMIAVTDHNSVKNLPAIKKIADSLGVILIPGMELETAEEIHMLCYFESVCAAEEFEKALSPHMPKIKNRVDIFGNQQIMDENDFITGEVENLLTVATTLPLKRAADMVSQFGGAAVPAHIDKSSYSIFSNLGYIPPECSFPTLEISKRASAVEFAKGKNLYENHNILQSSDAHYLQDISEKANFVDICEKSTKSFLNFVKNSSNFFL